MGGAQLLPRCGQEVSVQQMAKENVSDLVLEAYSDALEDIIRCEPTIGPALRTVKDMYDSCALPWLPGLSKASAGASSAKAGCGGRRGKCTARGREDAELPRRLAELEWENNELRSVIGRLHAASAVGGDPRAEGAGVMQPAGPQWGALAASPTGIGWARP